MSTYTEVAQQFGDLIAKADYAGAHALLTSEAQALHTTDDLKEAVEDLNTYAPGPIQQVEVMEDFILEDWPAKQSGDVAIVYVSLTGNGFCEAVSVTLVQQGRDFRIRELEWGGLELVAQQVAGASRCWRGQSRGGGPQRWSSGAPLIEFGTMRRILLLISIAGILACLWSIIGSPIRATRFDLLTEELDKAEASHDLSHDARQRIDFRIDLVKSMHLAEVNGYSRSYLITLSGLFSFSVCSLLLYVFTKPKRV